jgi:cytochrome c biogenesis protein CcmG, thiol:disulfide interchange protein DsbE
MKKHKLILALLFLAQAALAQEQQTERTVIEQPKEAFPFKITLFKPDSSETTSTKVFKPENKATLVAFWLTTCVPCAAELDAYSQNYEAWKKEYGLEIVAVSMDFSEKFRRIEERLTQKKYPFPVYWDPSRAFKYIMPGQLNGYPQIFLFDQKGELIWRKKGYMSGDEQKMIDQVKALPKP